MQAMEEDPADPCIEYVHSDTGLYPLPLARNAKSSHRTKMKNKFQFLGKFIAKAVLDNRMVDLPFSQPFYQWLLQVIWSNKYQLNQLKYLKVKTKAGNQEIKCLNVDMSQMSHVSASAGP